MPRRRLSPQSKRAATAARQARWRQRITIQQNLGRQASPFIPTTFSSQQTQPVAEERERDRGDAAAPEPSCLAAPPEARPEDSPEAADQYEPLSLDDDLQPVWSPHQGSRQGSRRQSLVPGPRRSRRQSSSQAQRRIRDYYRVSKSTSPPKAGSVASWQSRTNSVAIHSTDSEHHLGGTPIREWEEDIQEDIEEDVQEDDDSTANEQLLRESQAVDTAAQLGQHLLKFHGCEPNIHSQAREYHFQDPRRLTNHYSLSDLESLTGQVPDVLHQPKLLKHNSPEQAQHIEWARIFEGRHAEVEEGEEEEEEEQMHVCLHRSEQLHRPMLIQYDIDSALGYANSLAFAKGGLMINLSPRFHTNIQTNLHLYTYVTHDYGRGPRQVRVRLHEVPHYCLGYLTEQERTQVYVFFPQQWHPDKRTNFPGKKGTIKHELLRVWTDEILLPALARHITSDIGQHMPSSWHQARFNSEARFREARVHNKNISLSQMLHYPLQASVLHLIWQDIQQRLEELEHAIYRGAQLFFSSKNTKSVYKSITLAMMWEKFNTQLSYTFDFQYLDEDRFWLDLGKETVCQEWCLPAEDLILNQSPATYLMRSCCLEAFYQWSHFGEPASRAKKTVYIPAMLSASYDMTVEMSANSTKRAEGWIFYQMYNSYKEMTDVAKTKPFRSRFLSQLAWDSKVRALLEQAGGRQTTNAAKIKENYQSSKNRLANALSEGQKKSYGVREEHRISLTFFRRIMESLVATGDWAQAPSLTVADYPFWELSSDAFTTFLRYNANKYLYAIERILASTPGGSISYEHCKVISMLLESVKYCYDTSPLSREAGLWRDRYQVHNTGPFLQGMGLIQTVETSGYGWFLPKIDWEQLIFSPELTKEIRYNDTALYDTYRKRWAAVKNIKGDIQRLEAVNGWLGMYHTNIQLRDVLIEFICTLVMQSFRKHVFQAIKEDIRPEFREDALAGKVMLCQASLESVLLPQDGEEEHHQLYIVFANRAKIRTVQALVDFLWDFDDGQQRTQWAHRGYRGLHQRALEIVQLHCGAEAAQRVHDGIKRLFILTNWIVPYPNHTRFMQRSSDKHRIWMSICHQDWVNRPSTEIIPFPELLEQMSDGKRRRRHLLPKMKLDPFYYAEHKSEYMRGRWTLYEEQFEHVMKAIPSESEYFGHQSEVDMTTWGERLEQQWQVAEDALVG